MLKNPQKLPGLSLALSILSSVLFYLLVFIGRKSSPLLIIVGVIFFGLHIAAIFMAFMGIQALIYQKKKEVFLSYLAILNSSILILIGMMAVRNIIS